MTQNEIWILGATGRVGQAVARQIVAAGDVPVLVGRNADRLRKAAADLGLTTDSKTVVASGPEAMAVEITQQRPAVVVNTIGNYAESSVLLARACMPGGHYVDQANDPIAFQRLFSLHDEAVSAGSTLVTGAGFGVVGTEAIVARLCEDRPVPSRVRVDAVASTAVDEGLFGASLVTGIVDVLAMGGRRFDDGRLVKTRLGGDVHQLTLPDGERLASVEVPSGELIAAHRVSGAPSVAATSGLVPASLAVRAALPLLSAILRIPVVRNFVVERMSKMTGKAAPRPRPHTWGHAVIAWSDGAAREGWLRADDAMDFTAAVSAQTALQLAAGKGIIGAHTPSAALGADLAIAAGGDFVGVGLDSH
ncbi:saccharopine dehydrogenase NADP-binding domain-containing protein [Gordonia sp. HY002]|uniref:saccharopine dehydrogenase NADP-binding domain-containing protein n=1 Tax=Gordonia zhenghanii TaxID=2911516 RepID=UPI001EF080C6|nr:saccharopine dehydrogenase NADP-binding domain-containing protein [Gordonia zhenghanii]MCF8571672.1 saccharopine dehydrogenase NADP-binding domain-containing protein [Gordonia zhenghanii]MCF8602695.1 saccharopine dehydrogenase NADP-binding domain-containing protein [Gordonia zhenghanii]